MPVAPYSNPPGRDTIDTTRNVDRGLYPFTQYAGQTLNTATTPQERDNQAWRI